MFFVGSLTLCVLLISSSFALGSSINDEGQNSVCAKIAASVSSSSDVYYPGIYLSILTLFQNVNDVDSIGDPLYTKGVNHWANSSAQVAKCVVEPGTAADVGVVVSTSHFLGSVANGKLTLTRAPHRRKHQNPVRSKSRPSTL